MADTLLNKFLRPELEKVGERYVRNLRKRLSKEGKGIDTFENLSKSIKYSVVIKSNNEFEIRLSWKSYGDALNEGSNDVNYLPREGTSRLSRWVEKKLGEPRYIRGKRGKRIKNSERIAFKIQRSWVKKKKFPSTKSGAKGWANIALRSSQIALDKRATQEVLAVAYRKYTVAKFREINARRKAKK